MKTSSLSDDVWELMRSLSDDVSAKRHHSVTTFEREPLSSFCYDPQPNNRPQPGKPQGATPMKSNIDEGGAS